MNFRILVPYWGDNYQYKSLLQEWFAQYRACHLPHPVTLISDFDTPEIPRCLMRCFPVHHKTQYAFDLKGEIVCAAIQAFAEPLLVMDADALLQHDPEPLLRPYEFAEFAMPADEAFLGVKIRNRHGLPTDIPKRCAGVLWFGHGGDRRALAQAYHDAFRELETGRYLEERRLYEQHAWTIVAHQRQAPILPRTLNWADHIVRFGPNPEAAIYHRIGQRKWNNQKGLACQ